MTQGLVMAISPSEVRGTFHNPYLKWALPFHLFATYFDNDVTFWKLKLEGFGP